VKRTEFFSTALGVARRQLRRMAKSPPLWLPVLLFPLLLFLAFGAGLSNVGKNPSFDYPDYTTFQFVYVLMIAAALSGAQAGLAIAADFDSGFTARVMLATRSRAAVVAGYVLSGLVRALLVFAVLFGVALVAGMEVSGTPIEVAAVVVLALLFSIAVSMWAAGLAFRARALSIAPVIQLPVIILMFLAPVYTTRELLTSWVEAVATVNPITAILEAGRGLMVGEPVSVALAFAVTAGLAAVLVIWTGTGVRAAEAAGT
jgi:ABC-2 type transport system permease protein